MTNAELMTFAEQRAMAVAEGTVTMSFARAEIASLATREGLRFGIRSATSRFYHSLVSSGRAVGIREALAAQYEAVARWEASVYARGQLLSPDDIASLRYVPCEGRVCPTYECLPCGLRRLGVGA